MSGGPRFRGFEGPKKHRLTEEDLPPLPALCSVKRCGVYTTHRRDGVPFCSPRIWDLQHEAIAGRSGHAAARRRRVA